ncbi:MAG TPA: hypothetical protein VNQ90_00670 [Chthoniobacteraceae bacterium]|nr:hypothetical protein [Chthoniobacteraceae bacterium]
MIRLLCLFILVFLLGLGGGWFLRGWKGAQPPAIVPVAEESAGKEPPVAFRTGTAKVEEKEGEPAPDRKLSLEEAMKEGALTFEFRGNARDRLRMTAVNRTGRAVRLTIPAGQAFESANGFVVTPREQWVDYPAGETRLDDLLVIAIASSNEIEKVTFVVTPTKFPRLDELLAYLAQHPEVSQPAAQVAALVILENLPASAFAKFAAAGSDLPSQWDSNAFKVETAELIEALLVLRRMGLPDEQLAITVDQQTRIEAMIDPLARADAMVYYGIAPGKEWDFWKEQLLNGEPATRHYALYGIARYFPSVALQMLPQWAREKRTPKIFRMTAIRALPDTRRPEAVAILNELAKELGRGNELGRAAQEAAIFLEASLKQPAAEPLPVRFRLGGKQEEGVIEPPVPES